MRLPTPDSWMSRVLRWRYKRALRAMWAAAKPEGKRLFQHAEYTSGKLPTVTILIKRDE